MTWDHPPPAPRPCRWAVLGLLGAGPLAASGVLAATGTAFAAGETAVAGSGSGFVAGVEQVVGRSLVSGARWGMVFYAPHTGRVLYAIRPDELFVAASSLKVFIGGIAFEALGPDYRFRTRVYRIGPVVAGLFRRDPVLVGPAWPLARLRQDRNRRPANPTGERHAPPCARRMHPASDRTVATFAQVLAQEASLADARNLAAQARGAMAEITAAAHETLGRSPR